MDPNLQKGLTTMTRNKEITKQDEIIRSSGGFSNLKDLKIWCKMGLSQLILNEHLSSPIMLSRF